MLCRGRLDRGWCGASAADRIPGGHRSLWSPWPLSPGDAMHPPSPHSALRSAGAARPGSSPSGSLPPRARRGRGHDPPSTEHASHGHPPSRCAGPVLRPGSRAGCPTDQLRSAITSKKAIQRASIPAATASSHGWRRVGRGCTGKGGPSARWTAWGRDAIRCLGLKLHVEAA